MHLVLLMISEEEGFYCSQGEKKSRDMNKKDFFFSLGIFIQGESGLMFKTTYFVYLVSFDTTILMP